MKNLLIILCMIFSAQLVHSQDIIYLDHSSRKSDSIFNSAINKWEHSSYDPIEKEVVQERFEAGLIRDYTLAYYRIFVDNPQQMGRAIYANTGQGLDKVTWVDNKGNALDRSYTTTYVTNFAQTPTNIQRDSFNPWGAADPLSGLFYGGMNYAANGFGSQPNYRTQQFQFTGAGGGSIFGPGIMSPSGIGF